jgi:SAM-dependent methyltransferase
MSAIPPEAAEVRTSAKVRDGARSDIRYVVKTRPICQHWLVSLLAEYEAQDQWRHWDAMIKRLPLKQGQTVLDLGCGPGAVSVRLAARATNVVGVDQNEDLLSAARQRCPKNCVFVQADLKTLDIRAIPRADGLWCSFTAAYFPDFSPILSRWTSCLSPGGWVALVEIDDLWRGHHPLPEDVRAALEEFEERLRANGGYDSRMGRRLAVACREVGLTAISESRWEDVELAFDGPAPPEILAAWRRRFARLPAMKSYFGTERFGQISESFLESISHPDHRSTAAVVMVQAECPT